MSIKREKGDIQFANIIGIRKSSMQYLQYSWCMPWINQNSENKGYHPRLKADIFRNVKNIFQWLSSLGNSKDLNCRKTCQREDTRILLLEHADTGFHTPF